MKSRFAWAVMLLMSCTAAVAATPNTQDAKNLAGLKVDQICDASAAESASGVTLVKGAAKPDFDPSQPAELNGGGSCPNEDSCSCGVQSFNIDDPACVPGVDLGLTHCRSLHCPSGQTVHLRVCPCEGCGDTWSALFCAVP